VGPPSKGRIRNLKLAASAAAANPGALTQQQQPVVTVQKEEETAVPAGRKRGKTDPRRGTGAFWTATPLAE
jgi:hypothetical protein